MNYKTLILSRAIRIKIMSLLGFVPDKLMLSLQYRIKTGRKLNWKNPQRFSEKLQLYKLWAKNHPELKQCVDKFDVRQFVRDKGLPEILIPLATEEKAFSSLDEIDWINLPNQFVIKDTLGGGGNSVIVCKDKSKLDIESIKKTCSEWVRTNGKHPGRESLYDGHKHRIVIEEFLETDTPELGLVDYKFFCFNGIPKYLYVIANRKLGVGAELGIYDTDYKILPYSRADEFPMHHNVPKPANFESMKRIASRLSQKLPEVRVDLYSIKGKVYFGELTFFDGSGYFKFSPDEFDFIMGKEFDIEKLKN